MDLPHLSRAEGQVACNLYRKIRSPTAAFVAELTVAKERLTRQEKFDRAGALIAREGDAIDMLDAELRRDAGLGAPPTDSTVAIRHREVRDAFAKLGPSERLAAIHGGDSETLLALFHSPTLAGLLSGAERDLVSKKLLAATDPKRFALIAERRVAHAGASHALEAGTRWADAQTGTPVAQLRERIANLKRGA